MDVSLIDREIAELWRKTASDDEAVIRACTMSLAVCCTDLEDALEAGQIAAKLSELHPGRVILITPGYGTSMDAKVTTFCHLGSQRKQVCCEQITLEVPAGHHELVPTTLLQVAVGDVPLYVWWRRTLTEDDPLLNPLAAMADRFIFYSSNSNDPRRALARVAEQACYGGDGTTRGRDLTWVRLDGWREMVASFFDHPAAAGRLEKLARVEIVSGGPATAAGVTVASAYLGGWLASRLRWEPSSKEGVWTRPDGGSVTLDFEVDPSLASGRVGSVSLTADGARFVCERLGPERRSVKLWAEGEGLVSAARIEKLNFVEEPVLLAGEMERVADDPVFSAALDAAVRIAGKVER